MELKPCPFCGGKARLEEYTEWCGDTGQKYYYVACSNHQHTIETESCISEQDAIAAWNTRSTPDLTPRIQAAAGEIAGDFGYKDGTYADRPDVIADIAAIIKRHIEEVK